nr:probable ethanolamine kinase isoform X2 [Arachis hypogaea]
MGAEVKIWNPVEVAEQARKDYASQIHSSQLIIDPSLSFSQMKPLIIKLCKDMFKDWSNLDDSCFDVDKISGGITNLLLKVRVKDGNSVDDIITIRLYGPNTEHIIDRHRELQATKYITSAGFGAKWLGIFGNGMVQSFINAHTLSPSASTLKFDDSEKQKAYDTISFKEVHNEIVELQELTDCLNSPVIFSHNDLLSGNIMVNAEEDKVYIIDYEYASYNYRGFDIGNHFAEYAGFDCDFELYPNMNQQYHFFRHYIQPDRPNEVSEKDLETFYVEANTYALASHLFWSLWGIIQARMSPIDFDYLGYFFLRYNEYKRRKESFMSMARSYISGGKNK